MGKGLVAIASALVLVGCGEAVRMATGAPSYPDTTMVTFMDRIYPVRRVTDEPTPDLNAADIIVLEDGGRAAPPDAPMVTTGPAIRVGNVAARQTASDIVATYCAGRGADIAPGWRDAVVRFDDATGELVFYYDC